MIRPACARRSQVDGGRKRAAVCSTPPSGVGVGIIVSDWAPASAESGAGLEDDLMLVEDCKGRK